ncbi:MAG: lipoprotein 17-related variable surface protein, partial [Pirellulaceae bacterium]
SKLFNVQAPQIAAVNVGLSFTGGQLTIDPAGGFTGEFTVTVTATDGTDSDAESFQVEVTNHAPQLAAIQNQSMTPSQDTLVLNLTATDADGDAISFSATAVQVDTAAQLAYTLDQQYDFFAASSEAHNLRGAGEKYLQGKGGAWYFILADGRLYRWNTTIADGTLLGTLNSSYHTAVSKLFNVQAPQATSVNVSLTFDGSQLTVDPAAGLTGQFSVTVTATDGTASDMETFSVEVTNHAPELAEISDRTMALAQDTLVVNVSATDADGDSIAYSATAVQRNATAQRAYELDQQYDFFAAGSEAYNLRGAGEKYLQGKGGAWYFILADGRLYRWNSSIANGTLLGALDSSYHTTLSKLFNVQAPTPSAVNVGLTFNGGQLTIDPANGFSGQFTVTVTASDGAESDQQSFSVLVANSAPQLETIGDRSMSAGQDKLVLDLSVTDADGDSISYAASAYQVNAAAKLAYELDQHHDFYAAGSEAYNLRGAGEKYLQGKGGAWYFILADGRLYRWNSTIANGTLLGALDSSYHTNLSKLYNVQAPQQTSVNVGLTFNGSQFTIDPANGVNGTFTVTVTASDGSLTDAETFQVTIANAAPAFAPLGSMPPNGLPASGERSMSPRGADATAESLGAYLASGGAWQARQRAPETGAYGVTNAFATHGHGPCQTPGDMFAPGMLSRSLAIPRAADLRDAVISQVARLAGDSAVLAPGAGDVVREQDALAAVFDEWALELNERTPRSRAASASHPSRHDNSHQDKSSNP